MGEHQMNNSAIFSIQHSSENTALAYRKYNNVGHVYNIFESLKVPRMNNLSTINALNQLKHHHAHAI